MKKHPAACEAPDGYSCPVEATIDIIGGKWKSVILYHLIDDKKTLYQLRAVSRRDSADADPPASRA